MANQNVYTGKHLKCELDENGIATLWLDHGEASVNKFDRKLLGELTEATDKIASETKIKGLILASAKDVFVVGADITEFKGYFSAGKETLTTWLNDVHTTFAKLEDLPYPTVAAVNGICLGGGMEVSLTMDFRVGTAHTRMGLPETKLGIIPGWGGTVRLPRLVGADNAIEWIAGGGTFKPDAALKTGVLDCVVAPDKLLESCKNLLTEAQEGKLDWKKRQTQKKAPLTILSAVEEAMVFEGAKAFVMGKAGKNYPAPISSVVVMQKASKMDRDSASKIEISTFVELALGPVADNLVTIFLSDQFNKKVTKKIATDSQKIPAVGVLGAGIMGGGIAYQSASKGVRAVMKDIQTAQLDLGMQEASKLFSKLVSRGKISTDKMAAGLNAITPCLSYGEMQSIPLVIEAVVENEKIKKQVFSDLEDVLSEDAIIASNTSTISVTSLASELKRPENFCGIHFFNPVHRMPLVEIIRGKKTSQKAISAAVAYALQIGKSPIVVNDCPGFLVNRVLFPYFFGFQKLIADGADFVLVDKIMEKFGWPMGPAYLMDVVGIDTGVHASKVMEAGFPERMKVADGNAMQKMFDAQRFGQKNGKGFYSYELDRKGKPKKQVDEAAYNLLPEVKRGNELDSEEICDRMMIPMMFESIRCLEEQIVQTPMEIDLGVLYGLGFPPFKAGVMKYCDDLGLENVIKKAEKYKNLGPAYTPPTLLEQLAGAGKTFYGAAMEKLGM